MTNNDSLNLKKDTVEDGISLRKINIFLGLSFFFYLIIFLIFYVNALTNFIGLGAFVFLQDYFFISFIFGVYGIIITIKYRNIIPSKKRMLTLFVSILLMTVFIPLYIIYFLVNFLI